MASRWLHRGAGSGSPMHACALPCAQLMVVRYVVGGQQQMASVSRGMLRLVLLAGGAHFTLNMQQARLAFWGAALADAQDTHVELQGAKDQLVQQLATAAPHGTFPGVTQLTIKVSYKLG